MKAFVIALVAALAPAALADPTGVYTNVDGIVLGLVFDRTTFDAGNYVNAVMVVSNASPAPTVIRYSPGGDFRDTGVGDYVVTDADGNLLPKVVWQLLSRPAPYYTFRPGGIKHRSFPPGASVEYPGDLVKRYSLTNPGIYQVKAIAEVPIAGGRGETMVIETPPITVTVTTTLRPADSPLFTPEELEEVAKLKPLIAGIPPLKVTHPKPGPNPVQTPAPQAVTSGPTPSLPKAQETVTTQAITASPPAATEPDADVPASPPVSRNIYYGVGILILIGGVGLVIWRSRHKEPGSKTAR